jgi:hypothetical protein
MNTHDEIAETARTKAQELCGMAGSRRVANGSFCMVFKLARAIVRKSYPLGIYRRLSRSSGFL